MKAKNALNTLDLSMSVLVRWPPSSCNGLIYFHHSLLLSIYLKKSFIFSYSSGQLHFKLSFGCMNFLPTAASIFCVLLCDASSVHKPSFFTLIQREGPCSAKLPFALSAWLQHLGFASPVHFGNQNYLHHNLSVAKKNYYLCSFFKGQNWNRTNYSNNEMGQIIQITIYRKKTDHFQYVRLVRRSRHTERADVSWMRAGVSWIQNIKFIL